MSPAVILEAVLCNLFLVDISSRSHACPRMFLQNLLGRLETSLWITGNNKRGNTIPGPRGDAGRAFTSRKFDL